MAWFGKERGRTKSLDRLSTQPGALGVYAAAGLPDPHTPAGDLRLLAIDIETTGLDPDRDILLSIGFVPVDGYAITLAGLVRCASARPRGMPGWARARRSTA